MAFSGVLPRVVPDTPMGGNLIGNRNALLQSQILGSQAQYAPQQAWANAAKTTQEAQWLPYQYRMQALSNPMLWAMAQTNPAIKSQLDQLIQNPMAGIPGGQSGQGGNNAMGSIPGMPSMPGMQGASNNPLSAIQNSPIGQMMGSLFGGNKPEQAQSNNALIQNPIEQQTNSGQQNQVPLTPSTQGLMSGYAGQQVAGMNKSPYEVVPTIPDPRNPGHVIQVPTQRMATQLQTQIGAARRTIPQLKALPELWGPFLTLKGKAELVGSKVGNFLSETASPETLKQFGLTSGSELPSKYADAKLAALTSVESFLKSIGVPVTVDVQAKLNHDIEPQFGENKQGYQNRIQTESQRIINDFVNQTLDQIEQGYSTAPNAQGEASPANESQLEGQEPPPMSKWMMRPDNKKVPVHFDRLQEARKLGYKDIG